MEAKTGPNDRLSVNAMGIEKKAKEARALPVLKIRHELTEPLGLVHYLRALKLANEFGMKIPQAVKITADRDIQTALSQYHNLYFVAFGTQIHVFEPLFPYQRLRDKPMLVLTPPMANPLARGYIDHNNKHSINHLIVGDLGNDEILLLCTDSGNVAAYSTISIRTAIDREASNSRKHGFVDDGNVKAFFSQAVERSAWGLAIHKTARMIAVSCNAASTSLGAGDMNAACNAWVTIFAFSLIQPSSNERSDESSDDDNFDDIVQHQEWVRKDRHIDANVRSENLILTHTHHESNIPSIAFINNGRDPYGEWILSTDIEGNMLMTRIFDENHEYQEYCFGKPRDGQSISDLFNHRQMGWSVTALDPDGFHEVASSLNPTSSGLPPNHGMESVFGDPDVLPMIDSYENLSDSASAGSLDFDETTFNDTRPQGSEDELLELGMDLSEDEDQDQGMLLVTGTGSEPAVSGVAGTMFQLNDPPDASQGVPAIPELETELEEGITGAVADSALERLNAAESHNGQSRIHERSHEDRTSSGSAADSEVSSNFSIPSYDSESLAIRPQGESTNNTIHPQSQSTNSAVQPQSLGANDRTSEMRLRMLEFFTTQGVRRKDMMSTYPKIFPVLHTTNDQIRLIESPPNSRPPPFRKDYPFRKFYHPQSSLAFNRMNLTSYIPELGIMVIGTQIGWVAVLVLTKRFDGARGFYVDCILPTQQQFENSNTPQPSAGGHIYQFPLLGIATAPLQGTEVPPGPSPTSSDDIWTRQTDDIFETTVVDGVRRTHESKVIVLPSCSQLQPKDRPEPQTLPKVVEDLKDQPESRVESAIGLDGEKHEKLDRKTARRYRLMLYYVNHTVLSYEIGWS